MYDNTVIILINGISWINQQQSNQQMQPDVLAQGRLHWFDWIDSMPLILSCWVIGWCQSWLLEFNFHFRKFQFNQSANEVNYLNWRNQSRNQLIAVNWIELNELKTFNSVNEFRLIKFVQFHWLIQQAKKWISVWD